MIDSSAEPFVDLVIAGASTRAAAFSAIRAGLHPLCLDQFADEDLRAHALVQRIHDYPDGLSAALEALPSMAVMYTGGLENRPDILSLANRRHILWGNDDVAVARVRDFAMLQEAARLARVGLPEWREPNDPPPADGTWLLRPKSSAGGRGICTWDAAHQDSPTLQVPHVFQKKIEGQAYSATFIGSPVPGDVRFVGMTRQLIGRKECHATEYQWCGNIGPVALDVGTENLIRRFGNVLKWKVGLLGIYGVDFMLDEDGAPWVLEVNPRYPASLELLEHATGVPLLAEHGRCFTDDPLPTGNRCRPHPGEFLGKAIVYSPCDLVYRHPLATPESVPVFDLPEIADLPAIGQEFRAGDPVCTVYATASSADGTWELLASRLQHVAAQLCE